MVAAVCFVSILPRPVLVRGLSGIEADRKAEGLLCSSAFWFTKLDASYCVLMWSAVFWVHEGFSPEKDRCRFCRAGGLTEVLSRRQAG